MKIFGATSGEKFRFNKIIKISPVPISTFLDTFSQQSLGGVQLAALLSWMIKGGLLGH